MPAGPASFVCTEDLLPLIGKFCDFVASMRLKERLGTPYVVTFHRGRDESRGAETGAWRGEGARRAADQLRM